MDEILKKKNLVKYLESIDNEIVIVAPDYTHKNKMRIYKNGGLFGKIAHRENFKNLNSELMTKKYEKYCSNESKLREFIDSANNEEDIIKTFYQKEYLELAQNALNNKWKKEKNDKPKERNIETKIMRKFMNSNNGFITIDMEMACPKKWFQDMIKDSEIKKIQEKLEHKKIKLTKIPRFDIISFSHDGIGIIELKVDNENTENISSHYAHMKYILNNNNTKTSFLNEIKRRLYYLKKYELVNEKIINEYENKIFENQEIWCGFLYVGGERKEIIEEIVTELGNYEAINKLRFMYCSNFEEIDFSKWLTYRSFIDERGSNE